MSLNHLVSLQEHCRWNRQAKSFGGFEIQYKLELRGLLHREIRWICALEYLVDEGRGAVLRVNVVHPVSRQAADRLAARVDCRQPMLCRKLDDVSLVLECQRVKTHDESIGALPDGRVEGG